MESPNIPFEKLVSSKNIATLIDDEDLKTIGKMINEWYQIDDDSRSGWKEKQNVALKLALQVCEDKSYPWPNAANIKFPLLTVASLQFSARVYPSLIKEPDLVRYRVIGDDENGQKAARSNRVSRYISYQLLEENEDWESQQDKLFIIVPIVGCAFKKTYYDGFEDQCRSKLVLPQDLVCHYHTKSLETAERKTEIFQLFSREIRERILRGIYKDVDLTELPSPEPHPDNTRNEVSDERQGLTAPWGESETPRTILESHCWLDLDGDNLKEPYVVTVDKDSDRVLRIVPRFKKVISEQSVEIERLQGENFVLKGTVSPPPQGQPPSPQQMQHLRQVMAEVEQNIATIEQLQAEKPKLLRILPKEYYTKYSFIPSPDGGFYDLGFGQLLGPINESINTLLNQLVDAGSMSVGSQGFIGRGARIPGGKMRFQPFEWKQVQSSGQSIKESFVPLPVNAPSPVLFQLLGLLISYAERVSSISEAMSGDNPGQNTPAFNMNAMLEQGLQVFNGVFKRLFRSFRSECRKVYDCNQEYLDVEHYVTTIDGDLKVMQADFKGDSKDLTPAADPNAFSNMEKVTKAQFLAERSQMSAGYDPIAVEKRILEAMSIPDVNDVYPLKEDGTLAIPPTPNPEVEIDRADMERRVLEGKIRGETDAARAEAEIGLKEAQTIKTMMEAGAIEKQEGADRMKMIQEQNSQRADAMMKKLDVHMKQMDVIMKKQDLKLKEKDLELKEKDLQIKEKKKNEPKATAGGST